MKRLFLSLVTVLIALTGLTAKAAGFSCTVTWDVPGSVAIYEGSMLSASAVKVDVPAGATSFTLTEEKNYLVAPTTGYFISAATLDGVEQKLAVGSYSDPTKVYKIEGQYKSANYNEKTVAITTGQYQMSDLNIEVANGASKINAYVMDASGNTTQTLALQDGKQTVKISQFDTKLQLQYNQFPKQALYKVTVNGTEITSSQSNYWKYNVPVEANANVYIALDEVAVDNSCTVALAFTSETAKQALNSVFNRTQSKTNWAEDLAKNDYKLKIDKGDRIVLNFKEDYNVTVTSNGEDIEVLGGSGYQSTDPITVSGDQTFTIAATEVQYEDLSAEVFTNNIDVLKFTASYDGEQLKVTDLGEAPAGTAYGRLTTDIATNKYRIDGISGKTKRFFFNITDPQHYWIQRARLGNYEGNDIQESYLAGSSSAAVEQTPLMLQVNKIDYTSKAAVFFETTPAASARLVCKTDAQSGSDDAPFQGQTETLAAGWSQITFDPVYNAAFEVRFMSSDDSTTDYKYFVYVDGKAMTASENSENVFPLTGVTDGSVIKVYYATKAPASHTLNFITLGAPKATLTYDEIKSVSDFSASIKGLGETVYTFAPENGTTVYVNDKPLAAPYQLTATAGTYNVTLASSDAQDLETFTFNLKPASGTTMKQLSSIEMLVPMNEEMGTGAVSIGIADNAAEWLTLSNGTDNVKIESVEAGTLNEMEMAVSLKIYLAEPLSAAGTYTLTLPKGLLFYTYADSEWLYWRKPTSAVSAETTATYVIDPNYQYKWAFSPENGSENELPTEEITYIEMSLPDAASLSDEIFTEDAGIWVTYNDEKVAAVEDPFEQAGYTIVPSYGKPTLRMAVSKAVFAKPGKLHIIAGEGIFTVDGNSASPEFDYTASFGQKTYSYEFSPASGSTVQELKTVKLTFPEAKTVALNEDERYFIFQSISGGQWGQQDQVQVSIEGNVATLTLYPEGTKITPRAYALRIGAGTFTIDGDQASPEIYATWEVERTTQVDMTWKPTPDLKDEAGNGIYVNNGSGMFVGFFFSEDETITALNPSVITVTFNGAKLGKRNWNDLSKMGYEIAGGGSDYPNVLMVNASGGALMETATTGALTVTVPAGAVSISGQPTTEEISYTWNLVQPKTYTMVVTPADRSIVRSLKEFTVEFPDAKTAELFTQGFVNFKKGYMVVGGFASIEAVAGAEHPTFTITYPNEVTEAGEYTLYFNQGAFTLDGSQESPETTFTYTVDPNASGVSDILAGEDGKVTVATLGGVLMLKDAEASDLNLLPAGIYIVNGKKVAIRK